MEINLTDYLPFVQEVARRLAPTLPRHVEIEDLVQNGFLGLMAAAQRYDPTSGNKLETFAERRVRGAMIDALRKDSWPRQLRRKRRLLEAAREAYRSEFGTEPSVAELAYRMGCNEERLNRIIMRINSLEAMAKYDSDEFNPATIPQEVKAAELALPDELFEQEEKRRQLLVAMRSLPKRDRIVILRTYWSDKTRKEVADEIGVGESRASQIHARALKRLREVLGYSPS
jgi:RNA polymerase sigma factor for flagellar operon FliA